MNLLLVLPSRVRAGESVPITLCVRNGTSARALYLRGRDPTFDVVITNLHGDVIWRRLENEVVPAIVNVLILAPEEQFELTTTWNQLDSKDEPIHAGEYVAGGLLLAEGEPLETPPVKFLIEDRN